MRVTWVIEGVGGGTENVRDIEHAARVLYHAARSLFPDPAECSDFVTLTLAPVRQAMRTAGARAIQNGDTWHGGWAELVVRLEP